MLNLRELVQSPVSSPKHHPIAQSQEFVVLDELNDVVCEINGDNFDTLSSKALNYTKELNKTLSTKQLNIIFKAVPSICIVNRKRKRINQSRLLDLLCQYAIDNSTKSQLRILKESATFNSPLLVPERLTQFNGVIDKLLANPLLKTAAACRDQHAQYVAEKIKVAG